MGAARELGEFSRQGNEGSVDRAAFATLYGGLPTRLVGPTLHHISFTFSTDKGIVENS